MSKAKIKPRAKRTRRGAKIFIRRLKAIPLHIKAIPLKRKFKKVASLSFRKHGKPYHLFLVTNNSRVSLQNEICYFANLIRFKTPRNVYTTIKIKKPSG